MTGVSAALAGLILGMGWLGACSESPSRGAASIDGVCLVGPRDSVPPSALLPIRKTGADWVAVVPYAFAYPGDPRINYDTTRQWWGERKAGVVTTIEYVRALGLKVMLKPHVWVFEQGWAGDFTLESEEEWQQWEQAYATYLGTITKIADSMAVEILCIGTEYRIAVRERPAFWRRLIRDIRRAYSGQLTYAANWDNFAHISFWDQLDYIGIDAYFPLSDAATPTVSELVVAWQEPLSRIHRVQQRFGQPVLFTEYGYRSADYTARGHWEFSPETQVANLQGQVHGYQALYEVFWDRPWFAGGFLWKWFAEPDRPEETSIGFTPQNKPVMPVIREVYGQ